MERGNEPLMMLAELKRERSGKGRALLILGFRLGVQSYKEVHQFTTPKEIETV
jgi:hypothetical protein